jgi:hypothetical protein
MSQWCVSRSRSAVVILASPNRLGHSREREVGSDNDRRALIEPADEVELDLAAGLSERQIAEFVEDDEVQPGQMLGDAALPSVAGLDLQAVDEVDHVVEAAAGTRSDAGCGCALMSPRPGSMADANNINH